MWAVFLNLIFYKESNNCWYKKKFNSHTYRNGIKCGTPVTNHTVITFSWEFFIAM